MFFGGRTVTYVVATRESLSVSLRDEDVVMAVSKCRSVRHVNGRRCGRRCPVCWCAAWVLHGVLLLLA